MKYKKTYCPPALRALVVYPLGATLHTVSLAIAEDDDYATDGGDVKGERPFDTGSRGQRNLWDEVW